MIFRDKKDGAQVSDRASWAGEVRATLFLAWPLILSNLSGALIHATDV